ncbi:MAG: hypothetical protein U9P70_00005 [Patescibacteria group bacterium]|nr:hypothetical protein [Patescibacteria group bacterium]
MKKKNITAINIGEKVIEIAEANPDEILNIARELAKNEEFGMIMDLIEKFPNYAKKIIPLNEKYGLDPVIAFSEIKDNSVRIEIAKIYPKLLDEFVSVCPEFKETAILFVPRHKHC